MPAVGPSRSAHVAPELALAEYVVLGLVGEGPAHGFAVARLVAADGPLGRVYQIPRPVVYRSLGHLIDAGFVAPLRVEPGESGPQRTVVRITARGRRVLRAWLDRPVEHVREVRTELLAKLALIERSGGDPGPLLAAQHQVLEPILAGLSRERAKPTGFDRTIAAWRYHTARAVMRFLDDVGRSPVTGTGRRNRGG